MAAAACPLALGILPLTGVEMAPLQAELHPHVSPSAHFLCPPWSALSDCSAGPSKVLCQSLAPCSWCWASPWSPQITFWSGSAVVLNCVKVQIQSWAVDFDALKEHFKDSLYNWETLPKIHFYCFLPPLIFFSTIPLLHFILNVDCDLCFLELWSFESHVPQFWYIITGCVLES